MPNADSHADLVLTGGRVFTADAPRSWAQALAVRDGRIAVVGGDHDVRSLVGPRTRVIELRGRTVTPGFQDAHVHPLTSGLDGLRIDLTGARGLDEYRARILAYAAANPDEPWLLGGGWSMADFPGGLPRRETLDAIVGDRPAFLPSRDGHDAWVNTRALELAGITASTDDPVDGRIARDPDGAPLGTLHEGAQSLLRRHLPPPTGEQIERGLLDTQRYLHSLGITAWQDAIVRPEHDPVYLALAGRGQLTARVIGALWWDRSRGLEQVEELVARRAAGVVGRYAATSVKLMVDGIVENGTAAMLGDYLDADGRPSGNRGLSFIDPPALCEAVTRLDALGFQAHFHALGDRAVREALDAVEAARTTNGWSDTRPQLAHLQFIHGDDLPRFRRLGALANAQPYWAVHEDQMDVLTIPFVGPDAAARQYPWRSLRRHGATLVMGSDWNVSTADPLVEIEVAVTRVSDESRGARPPFLPDERLDLVDALVAFTAGSAHANHLDETGTLEPGRLADLVILDRDLFDCGAGEIGEARVLATFVEGEPVFEAPGLDG